MASTIRPPLAVGALAVITIIAISVSVTLLLADLRHRATTRDSQETTSLTRMLAEQTAQAFKRTDVALRSVDERLQSPFVSQLALDSLPVHLLLASRLSGMGQVGALFIVDAQGQVVSSSRQFPAPALSVADRPYFKAFVGNSRNTLVIDAPVQSRTTGAWTVNVARPLRSPDGRLRGVVVAAIRTDQLERLFGYMKLDFMRPVALYLSDGRLIASVPHRDAEIGEPAPELQGVHVPPPGAVGVFDHFGAGGSDQVFALERIDGLPLMVGVTDNVAQTLAAWRETAIPIGAGALLVCALIGAAAGFLAIELKRGEQLNLALQEADSRWRLTLNSVMDAIVSIDAEQNIVMFNPAAERMFGIAASRAIGKPLATLLPQRLREAHEAQVRAFMASGVPSRAMAPLIEILGLRADGTEFPIESAISQTEIAGKVQLTAMLRDVTERRRREAELRAMNEELRRLSIAQQTVREEERARISRELHDDLGQQLTGIKLDLSWLGGRLKEGRQPAPETLDSMRRLLDGAIGAVRRISTELRPRILDDLDFEDAIAWQVGEFARRSKLQVDLELPAAPLVRGDAVATALFRIVQESLTNIARHADATRVRIHLEQCDDGLCLQVTDDGRGFSPGARSSGIGLLSMRERATALGGTFTIRPGPAGGTTVEVRIPMTNEAEPETAGAPL
ncbi:MAG: PAS domain S-box protein [Betaproteobacteria bacterium]|nr:PAS domain S-box protein [Betaproteobacteria bacterium]